MKEMKSFNGILILGVVFLLMAMKGKDSMEPFKWLLGDWQMERKVRGNDGIVENGQ